MTPLGERTLSTDVSTTSLARSIETERLFSNILTLFSTDCGFIAGSSSGSSRGGGGRGLEVGVVPGSAGEGRASGLEGETGGSEFLKGSSSPVL